MNDRTASLRFSAVMGDDDALASCVAVDLTTTGKAKRGVVDHRHGLWQRSHKRDAPRWGFHGGS